MTVDGEAAGAGNLEILVNGGHVTSYVTPLGGQKFQASFIPHTRGTHSLDIHFNKEPLPGVLFLFLFFYFHFFRSYSCSAFLASI